MVGITFLVMRLRLSRASHRSTLLLVFAWVFKLSLLVRVCRIIVWPWKDFEVWKRFWVSAGRERVDFHVSAVCTQGQLRRVLAGGFLFLFCLLVE